MYTLGLDISTSNVGFAVLDNSFNLIYADVLTLSKEKTLVDKADKVGLRLSEISQEFSISKIAIEQNLQAFRPGFSSAKTLFTLARFNGVVTYLLSKTWDLDVNEINVNHARKVVGLKINRKSDKKTKEQVWDWVSSQDLGNFEWPYKTITRGTRKGHVILAEQAYDIADAYIIATACLYESGSINTKKNKANL